MSRQRGCAPGVIILLLVALALAGYAFVAPVRDLEDQGLRTAGRGLAVVDDFARGNFGSGYVDLLGGVTGGLRGMGSSIDRLLGGAGGR